MNERSPMASREGYTLVELLSVLAVIALLVALAVPSLVGLKGSSDITGAGYTVSGLLEQARTYALANNTYVWVGFYEEDGTQPSQTPAVAGTGGRLVISIVASQDGTRYDDSTINAQYPFPFGAKDASNAVTLIQINKLVKINNVRLVAVNTASNNPARPVVASAYQVGDSPTSGPGNSTGAFALHVGASTVNPTTFTYPLDASSATAQYTFSKIIEFNQQGEVSKIDENVFSGPGPQSELEIALDPTHGSAIFPAYSGSNQNTPAVAIQIEGLTGQVRVYRP
jgi:prepilin-type N-terminal cleavage/methylation domain-containing protein